MMNEDQHRPSSQLILRWIRRGRVAASRASAAVQLRLVPAAELGRRRSVITGARAGARRIDLEREARLGQEVLGAVAVA